MIQLFYFLLILSFITEASIYNKQKDGKQNPSELKEKIVIDHGLELYKNLQSHESDCFKKVTGSLIDGCNSLTFDSLHNMQYALMLTLCELSSIQFSVPVECQELEELDYYTNEIGSRDGIKHCIQKLSNLPQTWTTYSGYFRDVVMICFAIRYPLEKEMLERLHANITLNQAKNFDILQKQQDYLVTWRKDEVQHLEYLRSSQIELLDQIKSIQGVHNRTVTEIQFILNALLILENQVDVVTNKFDQIIHDHVQNLTSQVKDIDLYQQNKVRDVISTALASFETMDKHLSKMMVVQKSMLDNWNQTHNLQVQYLDYWKETIKSVNSSLDSVLHNALGNVHFLQENIGMIQKQVSLVMFPFEWIQNLKSNIFSYITIFAVNLLMVCGGFNIIEGSNLNRAILSILLVGVLVNNILVERVVHFCDFEREKQVIFLAIECAVLYVTAFRLPKKSKNLNSYSLYTEERSDKVYVDDTAKVPNLIQSSIFDAIPKFHYDTELQEKPEKSPHAVPTVASSKSSFQAYHFHRYYSHEES